LWLLCLWLLLLLLLPLVVDGAEEEAAGVSPAFGASAAMAAAAIPKDNKAEVIKVPVLFMGSPAVVLTSEPKNTPDRRESSEMKIISQNRAATPGALARSALGA
jgi:hypothetical protein